MPKKRLTIEELRERREDIDQANLRTRKLLEDHKNEVSKVFSAENKRLITPLGLQQKELEARRKTEQQLVKLSAEIARYVGEACEHREEWSYEHELRNARFAPESNGTPSTEIAQLKAIFNELMETFKRGHAENRAHRYTVEDLIAETERAALASDTATLAVFAQAARDRKLQGVEKVNFDVAFRKLTLPDVDEVQALYKDIEALSEEADSLFALWKEPGNQTAQTYEQLGRFNRKKRAQALIKMVEEAKVSEADALRLQWQQSSQGGAPEPKADTPEPPPMAA